MTKNNIKLLSSWLSFAYERGKLDSANISDGEYKEKAVLSSGLSNQKTLGISC